MRTYVAIFLIIFLLAACEGAGISDPYMDKANGQATSNAAQARQAATQAAGALAAQSATIQAAETAGASESEIKRLQMEITATSAAWQLGALQAEATQAARLTATAEPMTATAQALIMNEGARADREKSIRSAWRERMIPFQAIMPTLFGVLLFILMIIGSIYMALKIIPILQMRASVYKRGPDHDAPLILIGNNGRTTIIDPDHIPGPSFIVGQDGIIYGAVTPEIQAGVTARDQIIDLARAGRQGNFIDISGLKSIDFEDPKFYKDPDIEIIDGETIELKPLISEVENKLLLGG